MKIYKFETLNEYVSRGGKVLKLRPANAVRNTYPKRPVDSDKANQRLNRWRAA